MKCIRRTGQGDGALVASCTTIMTNLHLQRTIAKRIAGLYAFCTTDTQGFINRVFIVRIFNKAPFYCSQRAHLVFSTFINGMGLGFEKAETNLALSADVIGMHTLDSRFFQHTFCLTFSTGTAFDGIYLPGIDITAPPVPSKTHDSA